MPAELITKVIVHGSAKSIVSNPISSTRKGISMWWRRSRLLSDSILKQRILLNSAYTKGANIEQALDLMGLPAPLPGKIDYLVDGREFFPESTPRSLSLTMTTSPRDTPTDSRNAAGISNAASSWTD